MLIVCPSCASEYEIDASRVGPEGRSVRCAACRETWFITPAETAAAKIAAAEPGSEPAAGRADDQAALDAWEAALAEEGVETGPEPPVPAPAPKKRVAPRPRRAKLPPAAAALLCLVAILPLCLVFRASVVRAMPQSAAIFARVGMPVNLRGIALRDVVAFQTQGEGAQLVVEGDLVGVASTASDVPPIEVEIRDARDQPLYRWSVRPPRAALEYREGARFRATLSAPPAQGRAIEVRFAAKGGAREAAKPDASPGHP